MTLLLSMAAFALVSSITPGPVNLVALSSAARHGLRPTLAHVTGATAGFTLLLVLIGIGLYEVLIRWPLLTTGIRLAGVVYLLYLAWKLAGDNGQLQAHGSTPRPTLLGGAAMQWLNPKAWLASVAGMGAFAADGSSGTVARFALIYFVVCYASIACWAVAGTYLQRHLDKAVGVRLFNRVMAVLLTLCAAGLLLE
jgi:threonine/homoserine/homoserine lactone efflux protein